jgi:hypothetical protein
MRLLPFMLGIGVGVLCIEKPAEAQNYPWCAIYSGGAVSGGTNCGFISFEQAWPPRSGSEAFATRIRNSASTRTASIDEDKAPSALSA